MRLKRIARLLALFMVTALLPWGVMSVFAETAKPRTTVFGDRIYNGEYLGIEGAAVVGDTLYFLTADSILRFAPTDDQPVRVLPVQKGNVKGRLEPGAFYCHTLLSDGETLYALQIFDNRLVTLVDKSDGLKEGEAFTLDLSDFVEGEGYYVYGRKPPWALVTDGVLYLKKSNYGETPSDLTSFDLRSGNKREYKTTNLQSATPYQDGKLLCLSFDWNNAFDESTGKVRPPEFVVFDPQTDTLDKLGITAPVKEEAYNAMPPIYYDKAEDALYLASETDLYRFDDGLKTQRLIGYLPMLGNQGSQIATGGLLPLPDGRVAVSFWQNTFLRERTEKGLEGVTVLTFGGGLDDSHRIVQALSKLDNVILRRPELKEGSYVNEETLASLFLTGEMNMDVMALSADAFDIGKLIKKGYLADMSFNAEIKDYAGRLGDNFKTTIMPGEAIYAVPAEMIIWPITVNTDALEKTGLKEPASLEELLDMLDEWVSGQKEQFPEYTILSDAAENVQTMVRSMVMDAYVNDCFGAGRPLSFDTPLFRDLMAKVDAINYGDFAHKMDTSTSEGMAALEEEWRKKPIFQTNAGFEPGSSVGMSRGGEAGFKPLLLTLGQGSEPSVRIETNVLAVLSTSKHPEAAAEFVAAYLDTVDALDKVGMMPGETAAIVNPRFERDLKYQENELAALKGQYDKAEGAEKSNMEKSIAWMQEAVARTKKYGQFLATEEEIAALHKYLSHGYMMTGIMNAQRRALWADKSLTSQYQEGLVTLDEYIRDMDAKLNLIRLEYQ